MDTHTTEQAVRREAIRRRLQGQPRCEICRDLKRSPRWFTKWWREYQANPQTHLADRSRVPHTSPQRLPPEVVQDDGTEQLRKLAHATQDFIENVDHFIPHGVDLSGGHALHQALESGQ